MNALIASMVSLILLNAGHTNTAPDNDNEAPTSSQTDRLAELRETRVETLKQMLEIATEQYRIGVDTFENVMYVQSQLTEAQLESALTPEEVLAIYETQLEIARRHEEMAKAGFENAVTSRIELLKATSERLKYEIEYEKARLKVEEGAVRR